MRLLRALALIFFFCIDIHVKAAELGSAVKADAVKTVSGKDWHLTLAAGSLLQKRAGDVVELVDGAFYADVTGPVKLQTPYAKVWCASSCKALFTRTLERVNIKSLSGSWILSRTGDPAEYAIRAGTQVIVGEVTTHGSSNVEVPQSLPWMPTVREWAHLYPGKFAEFKEELKSFSTVWSRAVEETSVAQDLSVKRSLASEAKAASDERERRSAAEREDAALRALFREKNP